MIRGHVVRCDGRWCARVVKVVVADGDPPASNVSAYSSVKPVRISGALYQPLRAGDLVIKASGERTAPRPATEYRKNLVIEQTTDMPVWTGPEVPTDAGS